MKWKYYFYDSYSLYNVHYKFSKSFLLFLLRFFFLSKTESKKKEHKKLFKSFVGWNVEKRAIFYYILCKTTYNEPLFHTHTHWIEWNQETFFFTFKVMLLVVMCILFCNGKRNFLICVSQIENYLSCHGKRKLKNFLDFHVVM